MGIICIKDDSYYDYCCIPTNKKKKDEIYNYDNFLSDSDLDSPKEIIFDDSFKSNYIEMI